MADRKLNAKKTALIIQDLQNDVIIEGGAFASSGAPAHAKKQNVVENVKKLAAAMRKAGGVVIHVHYIVEPGAPGLKLNAPLFRGIAESKAVVRGSGDRHCGNQRRGSRRACRAAKIRPARGASV